MSEPSLHVVLVEPEIHWNTGNAGRTCLATGAQLHLVRPLGFSLDDHAVKRAGLDYWPRVNPIVWENWSAFEASLPSLGTPRLFTPEAEATYWAATYPEPSVLIFGKESVGFNRAVRAKYAASAVHIPIVGRGRSGRSEASPREGSSEQSERSVVRSGRSEASPREGSSEQSERSVVRSEQSEPPVVRSEQNEPPVVRSLNLSTCVALGCYEVLRQRGISSSLSVPSPLI